MEDELALLPICRVCLKTSLEYIDLETPLSSEGYEANISYLDSFNYCTKLNASLIDCYPKSICHDCGYELRSAYDFLKKSKHSDEILREKCLSMIQGENTLKVEHYEPDEIKLDLEDDIQNSDLDNQTSFGSVSIKLEDEIEDKNQVFETIDMNDDEISVEYQETVRFDEDETQASATEDDTAQSTEDVCNLSEIIESTITCKICNKNCPSKRSLGTHVARMHNGMGEYNNSSNIFLCSVCPKTFVSNACLRKHLKTHNPNRERPFECEICQKRVLSKEILKCHMQTHTNREPFQCDLCEKTFLRKVNLLLHYQMHRGETMDCLVCSKKFVRKRDLEIHMRFHTGENPYECEHCGQRFKISGHLNYHLKRHQGHTYKCDMCNKSFLNLPSLKHHQYEHIGMPFICSQHSCSKGFPCKSKLKRHIKSVHRICDELVLNELVEICSRKRKSKDIEN